MVSEKKKVKKIINQLWRNSDYPLTEKSWQRSSLSLTARETKKINKEHGVPTFDAWITVLDEYTSWFISLSATCLTEQKTTSNPTPELKAFSVLFAAITSHLISIRHLVSTGHDLPAKQVLRSLGEYVDLILVLHFKPNLIAEFVKEKNYGKNNDFWHKNISKGKARAVIDQALKQLLFKEQDALDEWKKLRKEEDSILSESVHPSFIACFMSLIGPVNSQLHGNAFLGIKSETAIRTIRYTIFSLTEFMKIGVLLPFTGNKVHGALVKHDDKNPIHQHVKHGRDVLNNLFVFLLENQDSSLFNTTVKRQ